MTDQEQDFGMDVVHAYNLISKYNYQNEKEVISWIKAVTKEEELPSGRERLHFALKDGRILCKLINIILDDTSNLPIKARSLKRPIRFNYMKLAFKQMENIDQFLNAVHAYGVPEISLFKTVDLYECQNMAQVLNTLLQLGTECQRNGFNGPVCGPKPTYTNPRQFSQLQLSSGDRTISLQMGTNKYASQKGSHAIISLQAGSNRGASQTGMSFGSQRHVNDLKIGPASMDGQAILSLQSGPTQKCVASQSGMSFGSMRNIAAHSKF